MAPQRPRFLELSRDECLALLDRNRLGRIAFSRKDIVDIEPIGYVHDDGWLYGRTQPGTKIEVLTHNRWVAFEVDEVRDTFDWASVVVKGGFYIVRAVGSAQEQEVYERAIGILRRAMPEAFTADDPIPERAIVFRIHIDEISGRAAYPG